MDSNSATEFLASLVPDEKLRIFAVLSHNLTIVGRDNYGPDGDVTVPARLRALNEVQHATTAALIALIDGRNVHLLPNRVVAEMYFAQREDAMLSRLLAFAFESAADIIRST